MSDPVNHPSHYTAHASGVECITITEHFGFCIGNAIKYLWRADTKSESPVEDLRKARWYIARELRRIGHPVSTAKKKAVASKDCTKCAGRGFRAVGIKEPRVERCSRCFPDPELDAAKEQFGVHLNRSDRNDPPPTVWAVRSNSGDKYAKERGGHVFWGDFIECDFFSNEDQARSVAVRCDGKLVFIVVKP